jgi:acylphosphatase
MSKVTKHLIVHGRVQGVGFRESMRMEAHRLNVNGWVRNRIDGTVEAVVHGWPDDVAAILDWARNGPPGARVMSMQVNEAAGEYTGFERRPSA